MAREQDRLRSAPGAHLLSQGIDGIPDRNSAVFGYSTSYKTMGSLRRHPGWQRDLTGHGHERPGVDPAVQLPAHASENQGLAA